MTAARATSKIADATATKLWVWDSNATAIWWHGPADAKRAVNVQNATDGRATFLNLNVFNTTICTPPPTNMNMRPKHY